MNYSKPEIKLLSLLMSSAKGLNAFTLFRKLEVPFPVFTSVVLSLTEGNNIKETKSDFYQITDQGRRILSLHASKKKERTWREPPAQFICTKLEVDEFYVPSLSRLDKKTFKKS